MSIDLHFMSDETRRRTPEGGRSVVYMLYSNLATFATHPPLRHASNGRPDRARKAPRDRPNLGALLGADLGAV